MDFSPIFFFNDLISDPENSYFEKKTFVSSKTSRDSIPIDFDDLQTTALLFLYHLSLVSFFIKSSTKTKRSFILPASAI